MSLRYKIGFLSHLGQPLLWLLLLGTGLRQSVSMSSMGLGSGATDYMAFMLPGIIGMSLLFSSMQGGMRILWDKKFGFLIIAYLNPLFYGVDGLRGALIGVSILPMWLDFLTVASFCIGLTLLSTHLFNKSEGI